MPDRKAIWKSADQFNYGSPTFVNTEIEGVGDSAFIRLKSKGSLASHIPFDIPGNYSYDPTKIDVDLGKAKLKYIAGDVYNWDFVNPVDYIYDPAKIEIIAGKARLKGSPVIPYALYHLNSLSGAVAIDSSPNGRDGSLINMEDTDWVAGKLNNCLNFNDATPINEYINCGNIANFDVNTPCSYEAWIKTSSVVNYNMLFSKIIYGTWIGMQVYILAGRIEIYLAAGGGLTLNVASSFAVNTGAWVHIVITYNGSRAASGVKIYVNSVSGQIIKSDTLSGSILNSNNFQISGRAGTNNCWIGKVDEVVIYDKELSQAEVDYRYNGGLGTEKMPGSKATDNPSIYPITGFPFLAPLDILSETATKPLGTEIKYHCSMDDGISWQYWNGSIWVSSDGSYSQANTRDELVTHLSELGMIGTFKFKALLHSEEGIDTPELDDIFVAAAVTYPVGSFDISMNWDINPAEVWKWLNAIELISKPTNTDIKYQFSINSGSIWNSTWLTISELIIALSAIICIGDGSDKLRIKFQLSTTDLKYTPEIDDLEIDYFLGYYSDGIYTSAIYQTLEFYFGVYLDVISFDIETPIGTTLLIEGRGVDHILEEGFRPYNSGDIIALCGNSISFRATLHTDNLAISSKLNFLDIVFHILIGTLRTVDETGNLLRKLLNNRLELQDGSIENWILYDDDDTTPLLKYNVTDKNGNPIVIEEATPAKRTRGIL